jgi:ankyrin repeat protein
MKKIFLAVCLCLSGVVCAAQVKAQGAGNEQLISCVKGGDVGCVARSLAAGASANAVDKDGFTALSYAAEGKNADVVKLLLSAGADVNKAGPGEATPLCRAALFGLEQMTETLLGAGAEVNVVCRGHGDTPLMEALSGAMYADMPDELKEGIMGTGDGGAGDKDEEETSDEDDWIRRVLSTPRKDFIAVAHLLLARGADVNAVAKCSMGESALTYAAWGADLEMVKELLSRGANAEVATRALAWLLELERMYGQTKRLALPALSKEQGAMLEWSEKTKAAQEEIKLQLRAAGAKEPEDSDRRENEADAADPEEAAGDAFRETIERNDLKDLERLIKAYRGHELGATVLPGALRTAVIYDRPEAVKLLLAWGVDPNTGRYSALMHAAKEGKVECVRMLLEAGADMNATDDEGKTALDYAESWSGSDESHDAVIELLKARGAKSGKQK